MADDSETMKQQHGTIDTTPTSLRERKQVPHFRVLRAYGFQMFTLVKGNSKLSKHLECLFTLFYYVSGQCCAVQIYFFFYKIVNCYLNVDC